MLCCSDENAAVDAAHQHQQHATLDREHPPVQQQHVSAYATSISMFSRTTLAAA